MMEREYSPTVMIHAVDHDGCHADDASTIAAWDVWLRRDYHDKGKGGLEPFDDDETRELVTPKYSDAIAYANALAEELECEVDQY